MAELNPKIGLIGAGRMATALARGILRADLVPVENLSASDASPEAARRFSESTGIETFGSNAEVAARAEVLILAVKPQNMGPVMAELRPAVDGAKLAVSIAAGVRLATLAEGLGDEVRLARVMPNTPCLVGHGASGFCMGPSATEEDRRLVTRILESVGLAVEVDEPLLDAVTGLSGSGPAFVYLMIEALAEGGQRMGLSHDMATTLAAQTLRGAAEMVLATGQSPSTLRDQVTSPGGTTVAGLEVLESGGFGATVSRAVETATRRSIELGNR